MAVRSQLQMMCLVCLTAFTWDMLGGNELAVADKKESKSKSSSGKGSSDGKSRGTKRARHKGHNHSHQRSFFSLPFFQPAPYQYGTNFYAYPYRSFDTVYPGYSPYRYQPYRGATSLYRPYPLIGRYTQPSAVTRTSPLPRTESLAIGSQPPQESIVRTGPAYQGASGDQLSGHGWQLLLERRNSAALEAFGNRSTADPSDVTNRIGYAMASAATGNLTSSVRAMRRACAVDAHAIFYAKLDARLLPLARSIAVQCESPSQNGLTTRDAAFLRAAIHLLTDEPQRARLAIDLGIRSGDRHSSALALREAIYEQLGETPDDLSPATARLP